MSQSIIPGERDITSDEMGMIRDMAAAGRRPDEIAAQLPGVDALRVACIIAPRRAPQKKAWKGRRR